MERTWVNFLNEERLPEASIVVCINEHEKILILRRSSIDHRAGQWTLPGGHIDEKDTSIEVAGARELFEETNLRCELKDLNYLGEPHPGKYYFWTQDWYGKISVHTPNPESGEVEHDDWRWATIEEIKEIEDTEIPIYLLEKALEMSNNE
tara:strand:+ start:6076 stop:6525 length:450 start_codon:yes stop_codon:yes gene_type:complete